MSWGHTIRRATKDEMHTAWRNDKQKRCSSCDEVAEYVTTYNYVTGKAGRVSDAHRMLCRAHAEKFAARYQLELREDL